MEKIKKDKITEIQNASKASKDVLIALRDKMVEDLDAMIEDDAAYERQMEEIGTIEETLDKIDQLRKISKTSDQIEADHKKSIENFQRLKDLTNDLEHDFYLLLECDYGYVRYTYNTAKRVLLRLLVGTIKRIEPNSGIDWIKEKEEEEK